MNIKTTLVLAVALLGLGAIYLLSQRQPGGEQVEDEKPRQVGASAVSWDFLENKLEELSRIVVETKKGEEWVFEAQEPAEEGRQAEWRMTSPLAMPVTSWELQRFRSQFNTLGYDISYEAGEAGAITPAAAGLDPPQAVVTLTDVAGTTVRIEIGKKSGTYETYVRLGGGNRICVAKADLSTLIKESALDYRDPQLWRFEAGNVKRVEITDRSDPGTPVDYVLARRDGRWMIEAPFTARATDKVGTMLSAMSTLRALKWEDDDPARLALYGLEPAAYTILATAEKEVTIESTDQESTGQEEAEQEESEEEESEPQTRIEAETYVLHLSTRSPIGEETKVYFRTGDDPICGTMLKSVAEKLTPDWSAWRDMTLVDADVRRATRVQIEAAEGSVAFVRPVRISGESSARADNPWVFEADLAPAEASAVKELLDAVAGLKAVAFVKHEGDDAEFGFDEPRAKVRLAIPGVEDTESLTIGGYTDEQAQRLVYVRRKESTSVAKVRTEDIEPLLRGPRAYRDRTVMDLEADRLQRIELTAPNACGHAPLTIALERQETDWKMVAPVAAEVRTDRARAVAGAVTNLRAEAVAAEGAELSAYGLHAPAVTVAVTYLPPVEYRIEQPEEVGAEGGDEPTPVEPLEVQPPPRTVTLLATEHDGKVYANRPDRSAVYELPRAVYAPWLAELRTDQVWTFDDQNVRRFSIKGQEPGGPTEHVFERRDDRWVYAAEPDLPLDTTKVQNLLVQVGDLRTNRFVKHDGEAGADDFGLSAPTREITVIVDDDQSLTLRVSDQSCAGNTDLGYYSTADGTPGVFLLAPDELERLAVSLADLEAE